MSDFIAAFTAEQIKARKTSIPYSGIVFALLALIPGFFFLGFRVSHDALRTQTWLELLAGLMGIWNMVFLPLYICVLALIFLRLEHGNRTWNYLNTLPVRRWRIYTAKQSLFSFHVLLTHLALLGWLYAGFLLLNWQLDAGPGYPPFLTALFMVLVAFIGSLPIQAIQFFIVYRFDNPTVAFGVAFLGAMSCGIIAAVSGVAATRFLPWTLTRTAVRTAAESGLSWVFLVLLIGVLAATAAITAYGALIATIRETP